MNLSLPQVRTLRTVFILAFALGWAPLMSHCKLESVPGFEFLQCSNDAQPSKQGGDPCKDGFCCSMELAKYHSQRQPEFIPAILFAILPEDNFYVVEQSLPAEVSLGVLTAAPPELRNSWQFSFRTALPPRAPSFAS